MNKSVSPTRRNLKQTQAADGEESGPSAIKNRVNAIDVRTNHPLLIHYRGTQNLRLNS